MILAPLTDDYGPSTGVEREWMQFFWGLVQKTFDTANTWRVESRQSVFAGLLL